MSIFTYHLIEALTGHAQPAEGASDVLVSDVVSYVTRRVPRSAFDDRGKEQTPDFQISGNIPVALLLGGKGLAKGLAAPDPMAPLAVQRNLGGAHIDSDGGAVIGGNVQVGGNFAGRDMEIVNGDKVGGDKVGRDKILVNQYNIVEGTRDRHEHQPEKYQVSAPPSDYIPRQSVEEQLSAYLRKDLEGIHVVSLSGLPGVGKSRIARSVASQLIDWFRDGILWADLQGKGETNILGHFIATFDPSFHSSTLQNVEQYFRKLKECLKDKKVLIVLENVDDEVAAARARRIISAGGQKTVILLIFRTRWPGFEELGEYSEVYVPAMSQDEARLLFRKMWKGETRLDNVDDETIEHLAEELLYLPVDMASIAREIRLQGQSPKDSLERLHMHKQQNTATGATKHFGLEEVFGHLPEEGRQLLPFLGVLGDSPWETDVLARISRRKPDQIDTGVRQLIERGLVVEKEATYHAQCYRVERVVNEFALNKLREVGGSSLESMAQGLMADYYLQAIQRTLLQFRGQLLSEFLADIKHMDRFVGRLSELLSASPPDRKRPSMDRQDNQPPSEENGAPARDLSLSESRAAQYLEAIDLDPFQDTFEDSVLADPAFGKKWYDHVRRGRTADQKPHLKLCMRRALDQENWPLLQAFAALTLGRIIIKPKNLAPARDNGWLDFALIRSVELVKQDLSSSTQWATRIVDSKCIGCELVSAHWYGAHLHRTDLLDIDMVGAEMPGLVVSHSTLHNVDARKADLRGALFYHCDLDDVKFRNADLAAASFINCRVSGKVDFRDTILHKTAETALGKHSSVSPARSISIVSEDTVAQHRFLTMDQNDIS